MRLRAPAVLSLAAVVLATLLATTPSPAAGDVITPSSPRFSYDGGPYSNVNVAGLLFGACDVPEGCDQHEFAVDIPRGYYQSLRAQGKVGVLRIALSWEDNANDFDLVLANAAGDPIATSGFGNSDFERINYTEIPSGTYTIQSVVFRAANAGIHVDVSLDAVTPSKAAVVPGSGGLAFSNGTPVTLERSSGEPDMDIAPNGDVYVNFPLGAGTNSILYKSTDNGDTFRPLAPLHPNNNPLPGNVLGGGDSGIAIDPDGRLCFTELNTLLSLGIGCSDDGGRSFLAADPLVIDPATPLVDRQWQAATPQGEMFITAQYGILDLEASHPGIRLFKETVKGSNVFTQIQEIDTGESMKSYNMAVDPTDTDADGGTIVELYLRSNQGSDKATNPHELMLWQSTDGGTTVTKHRVAVLPTTPGNNFASVDVDRQGNVYVAWSEQGTWDIFYSVAEKGDLDRWSAPVRVNADPLARTAIQPTIKVGDRGRVFVGFYAAPQYGNPDKLADGAWNAFMAMSTNGACMIDASPCASPAFSQVQITDHPVQHRGICLGGTGCGGDPYYGDRSMLEFLDIAFAPSTGQAFVVVTDSSRASGNTTITMYRQISGPSAYAGKPAVKGVTRSGYSVSDATGDAGWPHDSVVAATPAPGADITSVKLQRTDEKKVRLVITVADASGFDGALLAGAGSELLIGGRFATETDVLWAGMRYTAGGAQSFVAGHLANGFLVDYYAPDSSIPVTGSVDAAAGTITIDVPADALKTSLQRPEGQTRPSVAAVKKAAPLYSVTGFSFVGLASIDDDAAKHLLDVTPSFTAPGLAVAGRTIKRPPPKAAAPPKLPATGTSADALVLLTALAAAVAAALSRSLRRS